MNGSENMRCLVLTTAAPAGTEIRHHTDGLIEYLVRPPLDSAGYELIRMDELSTPGILSDAVLRELYSASLVVADLSFADPSVMYALGVRHSFGMSAIHLLTPSSVFPFDIEGLTGIVFDINDMTSIKRARRDFTRRLDDIAQTAEVSPVHATIELDELRHGELGSERAGDAALINGLRAIEQRLDVMERRQVDAGNADGRPVESVQRTRQIFIVHGHDGELKHQLARLLQSLDFEPVILQETADSGRTLIEKLRAASADIGFAFVLITADDVGRSKNEPHSELSDRARQNVIFEHGLFSGLLDPSRVCAIQRGQVELPSDLQGLVVKNVPEGSGIEAISLDIMRELQRAGYDVDANRLVED